MPGVSISTAVRTGPVNAGLAPASTFFIVGETERGTDTAAVSVSSLSEYESYFGGYEANKYTYQQIRTFFEEGGSRAVVARATSASGKVSPAISGEYAFKALTANPAEAAGVTLTAVGKGTWGNSLYVAVANDGDVSFSVSIFYGGTESANLLVETGSHASLTSFIDAVNNSPALANYCTASLTTAADPDALLGDLAASAFAGGIDGTVAESDFIAALDLFDETFGAGAVAVPGLADGDDTVLYNALARHCQANNRIALLSFARNASAASAITTSSAYGADDNQNHEYLAFFFPWVTIPSGTGTALTIPPEAYVAANRSKAHNTVGPWQPFAGVSTDGSFVNGLATALSRTDAQALDDARVNAIRVINNAVRIYGARSHSLNTAQWRFITHRDTINYIVELSYDALEPLLFSTINGRRTIYTKIESALKSVMEPIRLAGALFEGSDAQGRQIDFGYTIKVDDSLNPLSQLESGLVKAQLGVRISSVGDKIEVNLIKSNLTATLV